MNDFYGKTTGKIRRFRLKELLLNRAVTLFNELGLLGEVFKKRPLLLLEAKYEDVKVKSLVQNAETIRLVNENGEPVSVSKLESGMKVKGYIDSSARHFGMAIDENIIEQ